MTASQLYLLGFEDLVSVVPPGARLAKNSKIAPDACGKAPGIRYRSGLWGGYSWRETVCTLEAAAEMDRSGANVGLRAAQYPAVDIDVRDEQLASLIARIVEGVTGARHYRVGLPPKRLYPFRLAGAPFGRRRLEIRRGEERHLVEILGDGQQYVIAGRHPSGHEYCWPAGLPVPSELPSLSAEGADDLLSAIALQLDVRGWETDISTPAPAVAAQHVDQDELRAPSLDLLRDVVGAVPNTLDSHPSRQDYIEMAIAIRAAGGPEAYEIFEQWALRWPGRDGRTNTPESCRRDWDSLKPPFRIGWAWLLDHARAYGYDTTALDFDAVDALPPLQTVTNPTAVDIPQAEAQYSDVWLADRVAEALNGSARYIPESGRWIVWDGSMWREDQYSVVPSVARQTAVRLSNALMAQAANMDSAEARPLRTAAKGLAAKRAIDAALGLVAADSRLRLPITELDRHPDLIGTPAGAVDLRTGTILPPDPARLITRATAVAPRKGTPARWLAFLRDITGGDEEYLEYLHRLAGYWLTAHTIEHAIWFLWGPGGNGKSTFLNTLMRIVGSYAKTTSTEVFLSSQHYRHPTELASLMGARLVIAHEIGEGRTWDEARIKQLTGGDRVRARFLYRDEFEFTPECKIVLVGNAQPELARVDDAIRRRFHLLPIIFRPARPNLRLAEELWAEAGEILWWMIQGAQIWYRDGLKAPACVRASTEEYLERNDPVGRWIEEECEQANEATRVSDLHESWIRWAQAAGEPPWSAKKLSQRLVDRGFKRVRRRDGNAIFGLRLRTGGEFLEGNQS